MFQSNQKITGTEYTWTVALLVVVFVFSPAALVFLRPLGPVSVFLAAVASTLCIVLAWVNWRKHSQLTMPSLEASNAKSK